MTQYRRRPTLVDAVQWTGSNTKAVREFIEAHGGPAVGQEGVFVPRKGGQMTETMFSNLVEFAERDVTAALWVEANGGWLGIVNKEWILADSIGFYPCRNEIFEVNYEPAEDSS